MNRLARVFEWLSNKVRGPLTRELFSGADEEQWVPIPNSPEGKLYAIIASGECPDCRHHDGFYEGPSGGLSTNIACVNCGHRFNVTPMIGIAERLGPPSDDDRQVYVEGEEDGGEG
jgi:ribosomal protein S27E